MSDKPMGLAARLNKSSAKTPSSKPLTPISQVSSASALARELAPEPAREPAREYEPLTIDTPITDMPVRTFGAWTNGIGTIRDAVMLPNPVPKPKASQVKVSVQKESVFNKDPLGYITDEDEDQCDEDP
jgi:hypothetical protein